MRAYVFTGTSKTLSHRMDVRRTLEEAWAG